MYKKILVPLDGSKRAESILPYVEDLAHCFGSQIMVLVLARTLRSTSQPLEIFLLEMDSSFLAKL